MADDVFTSGSVSTFDGATGLRAALLNWCVGTAHTAEALSGSGVSWSGTLSGSPVSPGTFEVTYTVGGTEYTAQDDGVGGISGTNISAGTITYSTGAYSLTFSGSATGVTADYIDGEPGQDWEILMERDSRDDAGIWTNPWGSDCKEVILRNRGISGLENVMVGLREWQYLGGNAAGWNLNCYSYFTADMKWNGNSDENTRPQYDDTWNSYYRLPNLPLVDDTIYYWFFSNRQRIIVIAKVQSNYEACYLGFGKRYSAPAHYASPYVCKGSNYNTENFSHQSDRRRGLARNAWDAYGYPLFVGTPGGEFTHCYGVSTYLQGPMLAPMSTFSHDDGVVIAAKTSGRVWALPVSVVRPYTDTVYMDLDGVVALVGTTVQAEDIIKDKENGLKYMAFPDVYRSGYSDHYGVLTDGEWTTTTSTTGTTTTSTTTTTV